MHGLLCNVPYDKGWKKTKTILEETSELCSFVPHRVDAIMNVLMCSSDREKRRDEKRVVSTTKEGQRLRKSQMMTYMLSRVHKTPYIIHHTFLKTK